MNSGAMGRFSGFAVVAVTLGGAGMLLGSAPYPVDLHGSMARLTPAEACKDFKEHGTDGGNTSEHAEAMPRAAKLKFYPTLDARNNRIEQKAGWVGVVENTGTLNDSKIFPLKKDEYGCIWFIPLASPDPTDALRHLVRLYNSKGKVFPMVGIYCKGHKNAAAKPSWEVVPDHCEEAHISVPGQETETIVVTRPDGGWGPDGSKFKDAVDAELNKRMSNFLKVRALSLGFGSEGPWFPCADGCCRATME